jgi:hypothetical protein
MGWLSLGHEPKSERLDRPLPEVPARTKAQTLRPLAGASCRPAAPEPHGSLNRCSRRIPCKSEGAGQVRDRCRLYSRPGSVLALNPTQRG